MPRHPAFLLPLTALTLAACSSTNARELEDAVRWDIDHGLYEEAVTRVALARERKPDDPALEDLHIMATVAYHLDTGRAFSFDDKDDEALAEFELARELAPDLPQVASWIDKTKLKLASRYLDIAFEYEANDKLDEAGEAYERALSYEPEDQNGLLGLARVLVRKNYREGLGEDYYNDGVRALSDYLLEQASSRFVYAGKYRDEERIQDRQDQVAGLLASERVAIAESLVAQELYSAARNEYRIALLVQPENEQAKAGLEKMKVEAEASEKLDLAKMYILRGRFDQAEQLLIEWERKTELQKERFRGVRDGIQEARFERMYEEAYVLERDFRYPEAVEMYGKLLDIAQWYKDVRARKDTLEEYIRRAADLYARADAATSDEEKLRLLEELEIFWPEYKDVQERLSVLRGEDPQAPPRGERPGGSASPGKP